jgi:uncharacterized protein (TIGR03790 family)
VSSWGAAAATLVVAAAILTAVAVPAPAMAVPVAEPPHLAASASAPHWVAVPRARGRLLPADIGLVINEADPYSVAVGAYYVRQRKLSPRQVLRVKLPQRAVLTPTEFEGLQQAIKRRFGARTQALALAWAAPYAVECNSLTGALAMGFDAGLCRQSCGAAQRSPYFNSASGRPYTDHGLRPSMLLAAPSVEAAQALIDRGVRADGSLARRGRPPVNVLYLRTDDAARNVRMAEYPPAGLLPGPGIQLQVQPEAELLRARHVLMAITGSVKPGLSPAPDWLPGALADHLTSYGGAWQGTHGQGTVMDWIASGATASHGTVSEPCNHLQKFPHPQLLLLHYLQGSTAIEAYWKSVAWPQQSLFVGEPLAAPFSAAPARR